MCPQRITREKATEPSKALELNSFKGCIRSGKKMSPNGGETTLPFNYWRMGRGGAEEPRAERRTGVRPRRWGRARSGRTESLACPWAGFGGAQGHVGEKLSMLLKRRWRDSNARLVAVTPQPPVLLRRRWRCVDFAEPEELTGPQALRPLFPTSRPPVRGRRTLAPLRVERGGESTPTSFPIKHPTVTRVTHRGARPALATCGPRHLGKVV